MVPDIPEFRKMKPYSCDNDHLTSTERKLREGVHVIPHILSSLI